MRDICKAYKENTYKDSQDINRLVKDIGNECRVQEAARLQIPVPIYPCQIKEEVIYMKDKREERQKQRLIEYAKKYAQLKETEKEGKKK